VTNPLKDDFASFAEHAVAPDMHAKVLAESRRLGIRRAVVSGAAALAVLVGGVTGAFAVVGSPNGPDTGPDVPAASSPSNSIEPPPEKGSDVVGPLSGTFYYIDAEGEAGATRVLSWTPGQGDPTVVLEGDDTLRSTATVSPDGRYIAWREPTPDGLDASLKLKDLSTGAVTTLMDEFRYLPCAEPEWTPDSASLLVGRLPLGEYNGVTAAYVDVAEPQTFRESVEIRGCHPRFIAEGEHAGEILYWSDSDLVAILPQGGESTLDTSGIQSAVMEFVDRVPSSLVSVGDDGSKACLSTDLETVDRVLPCDAVIGLPGADVFMAAEDFATSFLLAGDAVISRSGGVMTVFDAAGTELGAITEPPLGDGAELLSYVD